MRRIQYFSTPRRLAVSGFMCFVAALLSGLLLRNIA